MAHLPSGCKLLVFSSQTSALIKFSRHRMEARVHPNARPVDLPHDASRGSWRATLTSASLPDLPPDGEDLPRRFQIQPGNITPREHWVYVIELPAAIAQRENPDREIVYVGMTSRTVEERFQ